MVYGIGIDIVGVERFKKALSKWGCRLEGRLFTEGELAYCKAKKNFAEHLAVRFAAKEATIKALGDKSLSFKSIEVVNAKDGRPSITVEGLSDDYSLMVSLSHEREYGVAQVIVEKSGSS